MIAIDHPTLASSLHKIPTIPALAHIVDVHWHPTDTDTLHGFPRFTRNYPRDVRLNQSPTTRQRDR